MARILCVDDEPEALKLKCLILSGAGHSVTPAVSAADAIEKLKSESYDAVVTDWRLKVKHGHVIEDGHAVVAAAKDQANVPVVVVSGYVSEAFQAAEPVADLYLNKPVDPRELVTIVEELLKKHE
jgi:CheY-like chemotaxis protein